PAENAESTEIADLFISITGRKSVRLKLTTLISQHDLMKIAYQQLKSEIKSGLLEVLGVDEDQDKDDNLLWELLKKRRYKAPESPMGPGGLLCFEPNGKRHKSTREVRPMLANRPITRSRMNALSGLLGPQTPCKDSRIPLGSSPSAAIQKVYCKLAFCFGLNHFSYLQVVNYATKAAMAGKELVENQQEKLIQLVHMLRKIETQVNSRQNDILQTLACHRVSLHKIFLKVMCSLSNLHSQNHDTYFVTLKLLRAIFDFMGSVFGSVENGVDELIENLAEHMCNPMVEYVKGLKADMKFGTCARLLAVVEEMDIAVKKGRIELEEARLRVRVAEEGKIEALCKLKEAEERVRRMSERVRFLPEAKTESRESCVLKKVLGVEKIKIKMTIIGELLKKRSIKHRRAPWDLEDYCALKPMASVINPQGK
ncbi:uncharacterized protein LOC116135694, partial [Pistacia vera]|uniref:uncharacterized protein LOC116135694 n=1 Tax=Pistacia vera TaxID=55513 RepID=UPI001263ADA6